MKGSVNMAVRRPRGLYKNNSISTGKTDELYYKIRELESKSNEIRMQMNETSDKDKKKVLLQQWKDNNHKLNSLKREYSSKNRRFDKSNNIDDYKKDYKKMYSVKLKKPKYYENTVESFINCCDEFKII